MNRLIIAILSIVFTLFACSGAKQPSTPEAKPESTPQLNKPTIEPSAAQPGTLQVGQASGSYTAKGEVVELKYAYAGRGERFGMEAIIVLVTDKPIPSEAVAEEIKSQTMLHAEQVRGLEYVLDKDSMWVRFHPSQYQESTSNKLKEYSVEGEVVRGVDENSGDLTNGKYARTVRFVAAIVK